MVSKAEVFDYVDTCFPLRQLGELGVGLGCGVWDRDQEMHNLGTVIAGLNPGQQTMAEDFTKLEATEGKLSAPDNMPLVINAVRRGVFYKTLARDAVVPDAIEEEWKSLGGQLLWLHGGRIEALGTSFLLTSFINGLDKGGFPEAKSKAIVREQIERVLKEECVGRSSYSSVGAMRHAYRVMNYSELHTPITKLRQFARARHMLNIFNYDIGIG